VEARKVKNFGVLSQNDLREIAFEFEQSIVTVLVTKLNRAAKKT
jgi:tRNA A37 threonylcarbamoyltransferase TsaD